MAEKTVKKKRSSNIELLRIICTLMVISLHMLNPAIIGGIKYAKASGSSLAFGATSYIFCTSIAAVDIFILISGFFMIEKSKPKLGKAINLLFVCSAYSVIKYLVITLSAGKSVSTSALLMSFIPKSYYVWLYCTLYIISPYINRIVNGMTKKQYQRMLIVGFVLFCLWPTIIDCCRMLWNKGLTDVFTISRDGNGSGFTIVNFVYCYLLGGYLKKYKTEFKNKGTKYLELIGALLCSLAACLIVIFIPKLNGTTGILGYETVFVVMEAVLLFDFFTRIDIGSSDLINFFAKTSFGVFLLHTTVIMIMMRYIDIKAMFGSGFIGSMECYLILLLGSYIVTAVFDTLAHLIMTPISKLWSKTKLFNFDPTLIKEENK